MEMTLKSVIAIATQGTIMLLMVSLGMETSRHALLKLWRHPRLLIGALIAAFVIVPLVTYGVFQMLPLPFGTKVGLWAISIAPGAPMVYRVAMRRGVGNPDLAESFQVTVALLVIVMAPAWVAIISALRGGDYWIPFSLVLKQVSTIQFIPVLVGMALHKWRPRFAASAAPTLVKVGNVALIILVVTLLAALGPRILAEIRIWMIIAVVLIASSAIIGGHLLAGPEPANRLTIANANAQRNPGLALTLTAWSVPEQQGAALVAIAVYMISAILITAVYTGVYRRSTNLSAI